MLDEILDYVKFLRLQVKVSYLYLACNEQYYYFFSGNNLTPFEKDYYKFTNLFSILVLVTTFFPLFFWWCWGGWGGARFITFIVVKKN